MKIAITGINSPLAQSLLINMKDQRDFYEIVGLDWKTYNGISVPNFTFYQGDIRDSDIITEALMSCDILIHFAFIVLPSIPDLNEILDINIRGSKILFEIAADLGIKKIIYTSSVAAYGFVKNNPITMNENYDLNGHLNTNFYYSYSKAEVERYLTEFEIKYPQIEVIRFRPQIIIGPQFLTLTGNLDSIFRQFEKKSSVFWMIKSENCEKCFLQLTAEQDLVDALVYAIQNPLHGIFNIAGEPLLLDTFIAQQQKTILKIPWKIAMFAVYVATFTSKWKHVKRGWIYALKYTLLVDCNKLKSGGILNKLQSTEDIVNDAILLKYKS